LSTTDESPSVKRERARAAILDDPYESSYILGKRANVSASMLSELRKDMVIAGEVPPRFEPGTGLPKPRFDKIAEALKEDPEKPTEYIANEVGVSSGAVTQVRQVLEARGQIRIVPREVRLRRAKMMQKSKLSDGLTNKQRRKAAARFIDSTVITLDSIVFAMESIEPEDIDLNGKREAIDQMVADAGKVRQFFSRVISERNGAHGAQQ